MGIQNIKKNKTVKVKHHYKWQFWVVVTALLVVITAIILWFGLSVKKLQELAYLCFNLREFMIEFSTLGLLYPFGFTNWRKFQ